MTLDVSARNGAPNDQQTIGAASIAAPAKKRRLITKELLGFVRPNSRIFFPPSSRYSNARIAELRVCNYASDF